jgi:dinuclear metal center YbgI/SA1388 family protein
MSVKIGDVLLCLNKYFNEQTADEWDNSGLLCGDTNQILTHMLICIDITQEVLDLAIQKKANLIISHHPVVFKPFLPLNDRSYKGKIIITAIKHDICIYSAHTNADKAITGINSANAKKLKLDDIIFVAPQDMYLYKISTISVQQHKQHIFDILMKYNCTNITFYADSDNKLITEATITEEILNTSLLSIKQETSLDYTIIQTQTPRADLCNFVIGGIEEMSAFDFIAYVKDCYGLKAVTAGGCVNRDIRKVAFCGGAGKAFLKEALSYSIDAYISGDLSHHDYQLAYESGILLIDATHYATEKIFLKIISDTLVYENIGIRSQHITFIDQSELFSKIV